MFSVCIFFDLNFVNAQFFRFVNSPKAKFFLETNNLLINKNTNIFEFTDLIKVNTELFKEMNLSKNDFKILKKEGNKIYSHIKIKAVDKKAISAIFRNLNLAEGAELYFLDEANNDFVGPIYNNQINKSKILNTGYFNDGINIVLVENESDQNSSFILKSMYLKDKAENTSNARVAAGYPPNVECYFPEYKNLSNSVAQINAGGYDCTLTLLNNVNNDRKPFAISAKHCLNNNNNPFLTDAEKNSLSEATISFLYKNNCEGTIENYNIIYFITTGATYIDHGPSDWIFYKLDNENLPPFINYAGWNCNFNAPEEEVIGIHHYDSKPQKISFGYASNSLLSTNRFILDWHIGSTTTGSSGSGLFNQLHQLTSVLSWGKEPLNLKDRYTKLNTAFENSFFVNYFLRNGSNSPNSINGLIPFTILSSSNNLCFGQSSTLYMPKLKPTENVFWSVSSNLTISSFDNNTKSVIVTPANNSNIATIGTVTATYIEGNISESTNYEVKIGPPRVQDVLLTNTSIVSSANHGGNISIVPYSTNGLQLSSTTSTPLTNANWIFPSTWQFGATWGLNSAVYNTYGSGGVIAIFPSNGCGTSSYPAIFNVFTSYSSYRVSPNPAQDNFQVSFDFADNLEVLPDEINLINEKNLKKVKNIKLKNVYEKENLKKNKKVEFDVTGFERGLYLLEFNYNKKEKK